SFSSLVGIVLTPLLAGLVLHGAGAGFSAHSLVSVACQLLLPFVAGQLLRRWITGFLARHRKVLGRVDRGSILLVVYAAFSAGMVQGIWHQVSPLRLLCLLGVEAVLLTAMLTVTSYGSRLLGFPRADRIAITFAGSKKSLAAGLPMAGVLFGAQAGLAVLPLMLFHQMQLMVCAVLAKRYAAQANAEEHVKDAKDAQDVTANRTANGTQTEPGNGVEGESEERNGTTDETANEADAVPHFR
ncbi:bile acid:sodium symporter family protein, partial [Streptomyces sp. YGL11-2]|uniref:bile acid:sodium symporter family protein n=1 Tax=Streptomyces sp. YGL11-2 TaxID=3414028 RepID=UPI003CE84CA6